jgi:hypothetical protein
VSEVSDPRILGFAASATSTTATESPFCDAAMMRFDGASRASCDTYASSGAAATSPTTAGCAASETSTTSSRFRASFDAKSSARAAS